MEPVEDKASYDSCIPSAAYYFCSQFFDALRKTVFIQYWQHFVTYSCCLERTERTMKYRKGLAISFLWYIVWVFLKLHFTRFLSMITRNSAPNRRTLRPDLLHYCILLHLDQYVLPLVRYQPQVNMKQSLKSQRPGIYKKSLMDCIEVSFWEKQHREKTALTL